MTFEDLRGWHFDEWELKFRPAKGTFCGFAARHDSGEPAAIICFYADEGEWWAAMARRGVYSTRLHEQVLKSIAAVREGGAAYIRAQPDPETPRAADYMRHLGFVPEGEAYTLRWN